MGRSQSQVLSEESKGSPKFRRSPSPSRRNTEGRHACALSAPCPEKSFLPKGHDTYRTVEQDQWLTPLTLSSIASEKLYGVLILHAVPEPSCD